jgi:hypothetical protein
VATTNKVDNRTGKIPSTRPDDDLVELSKDGQFTMRVNLTVFFSFSESSFQVLLIDDS